MSRGGRSGQSLFSCDIHTSLCITGTPLREWLSDRRCAGCASAARAGMHGSGRIGAGRRQRALEFAYRVTEAAG